MKVVHVIESSATGTLSMVCMIANQLAREGHQVSVIYSMREETPANFRELFEPNVTLRHIAMRGSNLAKVLWALRKSLVEIEPDVVHLHSSFAGFFGRLATVFALKRTAFFYSPHCISFMRTDVSSVKKLTFAVLELLACVRRCVYVACSESEHSAVRGYLKQRVVLLENAVPAMQSDSRNALDCTTDPKFRRIVTVGGIRPQKNPALFAEIATQCQHDKQIQFIWIGDGDAPLKKTLRDAGVEVTGWLNKSEVTAQLYDADIYLSTSSWEGMPVSIIEAMSCGTPVIASACAGNIDAVRHLHTGALFTRADEAVALIDKVLHDALLKHALGENARLEAHTRFGEKRFFSQLTSLYAGHAA